MSLSDYINSVAIAVLGLIGLMTGIRLFCKLLWWGYSNNICINIFFN